MDTYKRAYEGLNEEQRRAVDTIDGPLLVIAGPGTGKTQLLSVRVATILQKTDTAPQNILCLTFTNKAAHNMRERLYEYIGPTAYDVAVRTFHSFAADIMNEYPDFFWNGARLRVVPDAVQLEIIQDILAALPLDHPLAQRFAGEFTGKRDIQEALKLAKEAGLTPARLRQLVEANLAYIDRAEPVLVDLLSAPLSYKKLSLLQQAVINGLPEHLIGEDMAPLTSLRTVLIDKLAYALKQDDGTGKTKQTGEWKKLCLQTVAGVKAMHDERKRNKWWYAIADFYEAYRSRLHERGYYDYDDMLVEVITAVEKNPDLLADLQERYQYVLIDEFQDTNAAQLRLAHLVADHPVNEGRPNLMAVGDDDQSIFKFNGAELNNMLGFLSFYNVDGPVVLTKNYRSTQTVLDSAMLIAERLQDRLVTREPGISKRLQAAADIPPGKLTYRLYPSRQHQLSAVARLIADEKKDGTSVAVLARTHQSLRDIAGILHELGVTIRYERQNNILDHEAVKQLLLLADCLTSIHDGNEDVLNESLSQMLRHPMWRIDTPVLWQLAIDNRYKPHWMKSLLTHEDPALQQLGNSLLELARSASYQPLALTLEHMMGLRPHEQFTSPFYEYYLKGTLSTTYVETLSAVQQFRNLADEFSRHNEATFADFIRFLHVNKQENRVITDESVFVTGADAVELLTIHKAKGLEFDCVFIIDALEELWKPNKSSRKPPMNLPLQASSTVTDDFIRLFYVAVTRAKHTVHIAGYSTDQSGKDVLPLAYARDAIIPETVTGDAAGDVVTVLKEASTWPHLETADEQHILQPVLENFSLSPTALLNFLDIGKGGPAYFKERSLLRLPEAKTTSQSFGTAMHGAMELAQKLTNQDAFDLDEVLLRYEDDLEAEHLSREEFERYVPLGQQKLGMLFETFGYRLVKGSQEEQKLSATLESGVRIDGTLDRIDPQDKDALTIADYKTGKPLASFFAKSGKSAVKAWRHKTQLIFYALLAKHSPRYGIYRTTKGQMVYVEAETEKELIKEYTPSPEEIARMEKLAAAVWKKILACDFPDVSTYEDSIEGIRQFEEDLLNGTV